MFYDESDGPLPVDACPGQGIRHSIFGKKLSAAMDELRIEAVYRQLGEGNVKPDVELVAFLLKHLQAQRP